MQLQDSLSYMIPIVIVGFIIFRFLKFRRVKRLLPALLNEGAVIVDVRSAFEFQRGSNPRSINIPLTDLEARMKELDERKTIILCCASGARSGAAAGILKRNGYDSVVNAGSWGNT